MVAILVGELRLVAVGNLSLVFRTQEDVGHVEGRDNSECLIDAVVLTAGHE